MWNITQTYIIFDILKMKILRNNKYLFDVWTYKVEKNVDTYIVIK